MTAQMHERLIIDGAQASMASCPPLPQGHARILTLGPEAQVDAQDAAVMYNTACWRQYQGTWQITDGWLYLVGLRGRFHLQGPEPLLADWFSGILRLPGGKLLKYVHMGFESVYEQDTLITIDQGRVISRQVIDNRTLGPRAPDMAAQQS